MLKYNQKIFTILQFLMQRFANAENIQIYHRSLRFNIRVNAGVNFPSDKHEIISLEELFTQLVILSQEYKSDNVCFSLSKCKLDTVLQNMLETPLAMISNNSNYDVD